METDGFEGNTVWWWRQRFKCFRSFLERGKERFFPADFTGRRPVNTPWFQTNSLQNCERTNRLFKAAWFLVFYYGNLGNKYTVQSRIPFRTSFRQDSSFSASVLSVLENLVNFLKWSDCIYRLKYVKHFPSPIKMKSSTL